MKIPFAKKKKIEKTIWDSAFPDTFIKPDKLLSNSLNSTNYIFEGLTDIMPNPDPVLKKLGWNKDIEAYQELLADPQLYGAIENNRKPGITLLLPFIANPNGNKKETEFLEKFIKQLKYKGIYDNMINKSLDTPQFGWMVFGVRWNVTDDKWLPVEISPIPHHLCKFDYDGNLLVAEDGITFNYPSHPARYIVLQHKATLANPYGEPLLSKCYWNVRFKKDGLKFWAIFMERFGMPWIQASYNPAAIAKSFSTDMTSAANLLLNKLSSMARNGIIVFPDGTNVDITKTGDVASAEIFDKMVRICDEQNTKLQLGHSGATESTSGDKLSNDTTASEVRQNIIDSDKQYPISLMNQLIYWIHGFNFTDGNIPVFNLYKEDDVDIKLAERDATLVPVLQLSNIKFSKNYLIKNYGFADDDIETGNTTTALPVANNSSKDKFIEFPNKYNALAKSKTKYPDQKLIDDVVSDIVADDDSFNKILRVVSGYIRNNNNYEDALENLHKLYPLLDTDKLQEKMERVLFVSDLIGHFSVQSELENK